MGHFSGIESAEALVLDGLNGEAAFSELLSGADFEQAYSWAATDVTEEPALYCHECGQMIDGWAHPDAWGNYHCAACCPTCAHIEESDVPPTFEDESGEHHNWYWFVVKL